MVSSFIQGILLGLATGHICLASCGPVYLPYLSQQQRDGLGNLRIILEISLGRFVSYAAIGILAGFFGTHIAQINRVWFTASAYTLLSVFLIVSAFRSHRCERGCSALKFQKFTEWPILLGIVTGVNFCPSFLIALTKAVDLSGVFSGLSLFIGFFIGTSVFMIPFSLFGFLGTKRYFRTVARVASIVIAVWFLGSAITTVTGMTFGDRRPIVNIMENDPLYILAENRQRATAIARVFASDRKGPVKIITTRDALPEKGYIITEKAFWNNAEASPKSLVKAGRFILLLPSAATVNDQISLTESATAFLSHYWFRMNTKKGTYYEIPVGPAEHPKQISVHELEEMTNEQQR